LCPTRRPQAGSYGLDFSRKSPYVRLWSNKKTFMLTHTLILGAKSDRLLGRPYSPQQILLHPQVSAERGVAAR
jgi:hypothetical protein